MPLRLRPRQRQRESRDAIAPESRIRRAKVRVGPAEQPASYDQNEREEQEADPERALTWLNLGTLYQESGKLEDSIAHYREFLRRAPQDPDAHVVADSIKNIESERA